MSQSYKTCPFNFGGIEREYTDYKTSKVVILPFPYDATTSYVSGAREGPSAIIKASRNLELFDLETKKELYRKIGIHTFDEFCPSLDSPENEIQMVEKVVKDVIADKKFPVLLGGEHSLSVGAVRALKSKHKNLSVLQLDAHFDLRDEYENSKYNHACTMRRIGEICPFVQIGVRSASKPEYDYAVKNKIFSVSARDFSKGVSQEAINKRLTKEIYITIDLDVFDPAELPDVGTPEPGGLHWYDVLSFLKKISQEKNVVGFDVVELCPRQDNSPSSFLAAKLIYNLLNYIYL